MLLSLQLQFTESCAVFSLIGFGTQPSTGGLFGQSTAAPASTGGLFGGANTFGSTPAGSSGFSEMLIIALAPLLAIPNILGCS